MSYIGSTPTSQAFAPGTDTFNGDGTTTAFTLSRNVATVNDILVIVNNVEQQPSNYTVSGSTLTFSPAPSSGTANIYVRYLSTNLQTIAPQQGSVTPASLSTPNALYWDTSGNVGIGTTTPGAYKLNVNGASVNIGAIGTGNPSLQAVTTDAAGISYLALQNGTRNYSIRDEGTAGALTFRDDTAVAERMRIDSAGNVGIGTSAPGAKLDVVGTQYIRGATAAGSVLVFSSNATSGANGSDIAASFVTGGYGPLTFTTSATERMRIDSSGNVLVTNAAGLGYGTGSGGTVTQATSKATAVTLNKPTGQITINGAALAGGATVNFIFNNSFISSADTLLLNTKSFGGSYRLNVEIGVGSCFIFLTNLTGGSLSDSFVINFSIIKGAAS